MWCLKLSQCMICYCRSPPEEIFLWHAQLLAGRRVEQFVPGSRLRAMNPEVESTYVVQSLMITSLLGTGGEDVDHLITCTGNKLLVPSCTWQLQEKFNRRQSRWQGCKTMAPICLAQGLCGMNVLMIIHIVWIQIQRSGKHTVEFWKNKMNWNLTLHPNWAHSIMA